MRDFFLCICILFVDTLDLWSFCYTTVIVRDRPRVASRIKNYSIVVGYVFLFDGIRFHFCIKVVFDDKYVACDSIFSSLRAIETY